MRGPSGIFTGLVGRCDATESGSSPSLFPIEKFGFLAPVLVKADGEVIDGMARLEAAERLSAVPLVNVVRQQGGASPSSCIR